MSLHWTVDITVCQNDKLLYITPPTLEGIVDPTNGKRIELVKKGNKNIVLSTTYTDVDALAKERVRQLRSAKGLPDHTLNLKFSKPDNCEYLPNPDEAAVTGVKHDRGFTYLNLNGGDSWGYYHPINNPELLHNFKSEPVYKLRELAPSYYKNAIEQAKKLKREAHKPDHTTKNKTLRWVINDRQSGKYFKVTFSPEEGIILDTAPTQKHYEDFCKEHGIPIPEMVSDWDVVFDPTTPDPFNTEKKQINLFKPSLFKLNSVSNYTGAARDIALADPNSGRIPEEYYQLIYHVCGSDTPATNHFINWLAFIWQTGKKPETAWIFHGTYGTGKGRLLKVLTKLFGSHCVVTTPEAINEHFNEHLKTAQIVWIDEVTTDSWDNVKVTPKLRNWITEGTISIRAMRKGWETIPSYSGFIAAANEHNPVEIRFGDRRWNVAPRQEIPLARMPWANPNMLDNEVGWLYQPENLQKLADALYLYRVDYFAVRNPLENSAKNAVIQVTQSLPEDIVRALQTGNTSFFLEHVPNRTNLLSLEAAEYRNVVAKMIGGGKVGLRTTEVATIFKFLAGWNQAPGKFVKAAAKFGLFLTGKKARYDNEVFAGDYFDFKVTLEDQNTWTNLVQDNIKAKGSNVVSIM
jgi:hypothetical protein